MLILPVQVEAEAEVLLILWDTVSSASFFWNAFPIAEGVGGTFGQGNQEFTENFFFAVFFGCTIVESNGQHRKTVVFPYLLRAFSP